MDETENKTVPQKDEKTPKRRFTLLGVVASILSIGSMGWTTFSLLDFFQPGGFDLAHIHLKDVNPMGLSAAATADIVWGGTILAAYRGVRIFAPVWKEKGEKVKRIDILPAIGWIEVLFIAGLLAKHGSTMASHGAAFAAVLPIATKLAWMMALADLKDPDAPTEEDRQRSAAIRRKANVKREMLEATGQLHAAELEAQRRENERLLEDKRAEAERLKLEQQTAFELEQDRLRRENETKSMRRRLETERQIEELEQRNTVEQLRDEHEFSMSLRRRPQTIVGQTVPRSGLSFTAPLGITDGADGALEAGDPYSGLKPGQRKQADLARRWYAVDAQYGGTVTKAAFCQEIEERAPRLSEATTAFPPEWFIERGLADWLVHQN